VAKGGQRLLDFSKAMAGRYDGLPEVSDDAAIIVNSFGLGRSVYFSGDLGNAILNFHLPEHLRLVGNAVRELAPPPASLENAPEPIELVIAAALRELYGRNDASHPTRAAARESASLASPRAGVLQSLLPRAAGKPEGAKVELRRTPVRAAPTE
jgi:hypothetical protein